MAATAAATATTDDDHRRANPDHPIYALMIAEAIRSLDEAEGSTQASISEYIKANFSGLPMGHDRLLPYYLNKLINNGEAEFVIGPHGRYIMAQAQDGDPSNAAEAQEDGSMNKLGIAEAPVFEETVNADAAESVSPECQVAKLDEDATVDTALEEEDDDDDEGVPLSREGDLVKELKPAVSEPSPKKRGRPLKRTWKRNLTGKSRATKAQYSEKLVLKKIRPQQEHGAQKLVPDRRERPPKRKCTEPIQLIDPSTFVIDGNGVETNVYEENQVNRSTTPMPKRRGRPPKINPETMDTSMAVVAHNGNVKLPVPEEGSDGSKPVIMRYGRPPKRKHDGDVEPLQLVVPSSLGANGNAKKKSYKKKATRNKDDGAEPIPKRRGRPPKTKSDGGAEPLQSADDNDKLVVYGKGKRRKDDGSEPVLKRLGRSPKRKSEPIAQDGDAKLAKKRRKSKKGSNQESSGVSMDPKDNAVMQEGQRKSDPVAKRRGRPPKIDSTSIPKRRGRPPKAKPETQGIRRR